MHPGPSSASLHFPHISSTQMYLVLPLVATGPTDRGSWFFQPNFGSSVCLVQAMLTMRQLFSDLSEPPLNCGTQSSEHSDRAYS